MDGIQNGSQDETAVRKVIEEWARAVRGKDMEGILRHHAADMSMFDVPPPFQSKGIDAYRETWQTFFTWAHNPVVYSIKEMNVVAGSDVAFVVASMQCAGREASGEDIELDFRLTVGLRKIDGQWTIVHEHHSIPATQ
ncbi:MAG TPA: SgcJ/EcaC family oxidoreductase [Rhizomicrobium sp.]|nr:SgcJ/EcaC family oxidoreductase [Rhizomicrobium sp.]